MNAIAEPCPKSADDLDRLRLTDPANPADQFLAAGAPWFLTLFGRDSLWAARMLLPLGTGLAAGTLRVLARRQGTKSDPGTEEQPGKILHEVRRATQDFNENFSLPPCYYGTVDATPLWVTLLHDSWRWGLAPEQVEQLLPYAESALAWMRDHGDADGDGFLKYIDHTRRSVLGLSADVPGGTLTVAPGFAEAYRPLKVEGFDIAGERLDITVDADGTAHVEAPKSLLVRRQHMTPR